MPELTIPQCAAMLRALGTHARELGDLGVTVPSILTLADAVVGAAAHRSWREAAGTEAADRRARQLGALLHRAAGGDVEATRDLLYGAGAVYCGNHADAAPLEVPLAAPGDTLCPSCRDRETASIFGAATDGEREPDLGLAAATAAGALLVEQGAFAGVRVEATR